jgi:hypothetical protein
MYLAYNDITNYLFQYNCPKSRLFLEFNHPLVLEKESRLTLPSSYINSRLGNDNIMVIHFVRKASLYVSAPTIKKRWVT